MQSYIAVFDLGKTNKKISIFDLNLNVIDSIKSNCSEYIKDGIHFERIDEIKAWFFEKLKYFSALYNIGCVSITTHGSTIVAIDKNGNIPLPVVSYTTEPGEAFHTAFYSQFGNPDTLQLETATPPMGCLVNTAKNIYFQKLNFPKQYDNVYRIINYPQYFSYILTGKISIEPTYLGCHSYLWNFQKLEYSSVAKKLRIINKLPDHFSLPWVPLGKVTVEAAENTGLSTETIVLVGVHDSNSSLIPYILKSKNEFVLNSTGTWCVMMHPVKELEFKNDEIGKMIFYNLNIYSKPVKTSILMGGLEYNTWAKIFMQVTGKNDVPVFDQAIYNKILKERKLFITPSIQKGTGQFPNSEPCAYQNGKRYTFSDILKGIIPSFFKDLKMAYAVLNISLVIQSQYALKRTGMKNNMDLYVEGGFRNNFDYITMLSALYPKSRVMLTDLREATSFGAAILGLAGIKGKCPENYSDCIELKSHLIRKRIFPDMIKYKQSFEMLL